MNTNYKRGRAFEYRVKKMYEKNGCFAVRAAGSHGPVDILVITDFGKPLFVQCKLSGVISKQERKDLKALAEFYRASPVVALNQRGKIITCSP
jgi:Holliday junction resolvase